MSKGIKINVKNHSAETLQVYRQIYIYRSPQQEPKTTAKRIRYVNRWYRLQKNIDGYFIDISKPL
jgi:hypothetical protein